MLNIKDLRSGLVVSLVALPLCLGIALASEAPLLSGLISGIVGGVVVGLISGSHTSVSGPAAGLAAVVISQIHMLGGFSTFLAAVVMAGVIQIGLGVARAGFIGAFFPNSVIKGLLSSIGLLLILKQIPHLMGHDSDPEGDFDFFQINQENTFSSLWTCLTEDFHWGVALIGITCLAIYIWGDKSRFMKRQPLPLALIVILVSVGIAQILAYFGLELQNTHLVNVPTLGSIQDLYQLNLRPDFSTVLSSKFWLAAFTIAMVASLETLINLEAIDKIDPKQRVSSANRELVAQGVGNILAGALGGLPITSVVVRGAVNINAGAESKLSSVVHGLFLLLAVVFIGPWLNNIPLAGLAAILLVAGFKLLNPQEIRHIFASPREQYLPFFITILLVLSTNILIGVCAGLLCAIAFILRSNFRRSFRMHQELHFRTLVTRLELPMQMTFLGRASLMRAFQSLPSGSEMLIDATGTDTMDSDIVEVIKDMRSLMGPRRGISVSVRGLEKFTPLPDYCAFEDLPTKELQKRLKPEEILEVLKEGNQRFCQGLRMPRPLLKQFSSTASGQYPLAVVLNCIDSRNAAELVFDTGIGELFCVRIAGNIISKKILGSLEYCVGVAGAKLIVVMGHTSCGAITAAATHALSGALPPVAARCSHLPQVVDSIITGTNLHTRTLPEEISEQFVNELAHLNMQHSLKQIYEESTMVAELVDAGKILLVGAMYHVATGHVDFFPKELPSAPSSSRNSDSSYLTK